MGSFITLEGGEGSGKSTQAAKLCDYLRSQGNEVVLTREPGGTPDAEKVRHLLVQGDPDRWSAQAEALLTYAARDDHIRKLIRPALERGEWVVSDRFMDSTRAYQAYAGGCAHSLIDALERAIVGATRPRVTFIFDIDPSIGLARTGRRDVSLDDRFERKGREFHDKLRLGYLEIASREPHRCKVIDASQSEDAVFRDMLAQLNELSDG